MKRLLSVLLVVGILLMMTACTISEKVQDTSSSVSTSATTSDTTSEQEVINDNNSCTFIARILDVGRTLYVRGNANAFGMYSGFAHLPNDISEENFQKGDYVSITFPGLIMESYPPQIGITSIRHLTKAEIAELPKIDEKEIRLEYMGQDETEIIGICMGQVYSVSLKDFENIPAMTYGDYFSVVYEERLEGIESIKLLFIKDLYLSDEYGNCIE